MISELMNADFSEVVKAILSDISAPHFSSSVTICLMYLALPCRKHRLPFLEIETMSASLLFKFYLTDEHISVQKPLAKSISLDRELAPSSLHVHFIHFSTMLQLSCF